MLRSGICEGTENLFIKMVKKGILSKNDRKKMDGKAQGAE